MALHTPVTWLVAYDISDPRRLNRVHRLLKEKGVLIQYSLFAVRDSAQGILRLKTELAGLIDTKADDVRIYRLPQTPSFVAIGLPLLPEDLLLFTDGGTDIACRLQAHQRSHD